MANIGIKLKKARERLGYDYDFVTQKAKIHPKVLAALEEENFGYFKSPLYLRSFLGKYAQFLNLDKEQILSELDILPPELKSKEQGYARSGSMPNKIILVLKTAMISVFIVGSIYFIFLGVKKVLAVFINNNDINIESEDLLDVKIIEDDSIAVKEAVYKSNLEENVLVELTIKANEDCWIRLRADNEKIFDSILKTNQSETWNAKDEFELWVGDASRLSFILNGKNIGSIGRGIIRGIKLTADGITLP